MVLEAMTLLNASASQGFPQAQYYLGMAHLNGVGSRTGHRGPGVAYLQQAADQGFASALHKLGLLYAEGTGVDRDLIKAYVYLNLAIDQGDEGALAGRDGLLPQLSAAQIQQAKKA